MTIRGTGVSHTAAFILTTAAIAVALLYSNSVAQMPDPPGPGGPPFAREEMMERFDTDGDGELSEEERAAMREMRQNFMGRGGRRGGGPFGMMLQRVKLVEQFDADSDGKLNDEERKAARKYIQDERDSKGEPLPEREDTEIAPDLETDVAKADYDPDADLYNEKVLRTLYLEFPNEDWYEEMGDFYRTDVDVPTDLTVDGVKYPAVGVRFRGNTSYAMVRNSAKKPFNIAIDYNDLNQRLYGYKTLNLLSGHADPSFIREILYSRICREYIPAPKANFVKLVINGENWGVYINLQQFNKDFLKEWYGTRGGVRWKISPSRGNPGSLVWNGPEIANYEDAFQLKTNLNEKKTVAAWEALIKLCEALNKTSDEQLEAALDPIFDIDGALWFIALENVFIDSDGYISRGSDYYLYMDPDGKFHLIPYDNNETFRFAGGGGPNMWPNNDPMLSPVAHEDNEDLPVISRLLSIPHLRARYLSHVRTIIDEWLDWNVLSPIIEEYQLLIDAEVKADSKKLYPYDAFANSQTEDYSGGEGFGPPGGFGRPGGLGRRGDSDRRGGRGRRGPGPGITPSFKRFVSERREFLLNHAEVSKAAPETRRFTAPVTTEAVQVNTAEGSQIVINELMALNAASVTDPQGEYDDWIELHNVSDREIDLSEMYLSDNRDNLRKWSFPEGTIIPPKGYLIIWADEDSKAQPGLHANFKLSKNGEIVMLIDRDEDGNAILDLVEFGKQEEDIAIGRFPDSVGEFVRLAMTPGEKNQSPKQ